jgi:hypothetical protein
MHRIFAGMAVWAVVIMVAQFAFGIMTRRLDPKWLGLHMAFGVFTGIYLCILHVMVMFHFIGSSKEMKEAIQVLGGDSETVRKIRRLKMLVMPPATFAPVLVGAGVILGGGAHTRALGDWAWIHWALALGGLAMNLWALPIEYRCLLANLELLREVDDKIKREIAPTLYREG